MSTTTPNLGLVLPVGIENVSRHIINQNNEKIDTAFGKTFRDIPFAIAVGDWSASGNNYVATFNTAYVTTTSKDTIVFDKSLNDYSKGSVMISEKESGGGGVKFTTDKLPTGTLTGTIWTIDTDDGKIPIIIENTVTPIANGGTGQSSLAGAKVALGIPDVVDNVTTNDGSKALSAKQGKLLNDQIAYNSYNFKDYFTRSDGGQQSDVYGTISKMGNVVTIAGQVGSVAATTSGVTIGSLSKYYPSAYEINVDGFVGASSNKGANAKVVLGTDKSIKVYVDSATTNTLRFSCTFCTSAI